MTRTEANCFYVGFPLMLALILGWNHALLGESTSRTVTIAFLAVLLTSLWWVTAAFSNLANLATTHRQLPLWLTTLTGAAIAAIVSLPLVRMYLVWGYSWSGNVEAIADMAPISFSMTYFRSFFASIFPGSLIWVLANYFYRNVLHIPRYGTMERRQTPLASHESDRALDQPVQEPPFMKKLPVSRQGPIIALKAEDHYIHVYTENGNGLVRWGFSDALMFMDALNGLRVHRSYWVSKNAIKSLQKNGHSYELHLKDDLIVPVSRGYLKDTRLALRQQPNDQ